MYQNVNFPFVQYIGPKSEVKSGHHHIQLINSKILQSELIADFAFTYRVICIQHNSLIYVMMQLYFDSSQSSTLIIRTFNDNIKYA